MKVEEKLKEFCKAHGIDGILAVAMKDTEETLDAAIVAVGHAESIPMRYIMDVGPLLIQKKLIPEAMSAPKVVAMIGDIVGKATSQTKDPSGDKAAG